MRIFLLGFMGSGKTTIGIQLSHALNYPFFDLDQYIEKQVNKSISDIFELEGENCFRQYETYHLIEIINKSNKAVVATGGGTPCFNQNMQIMQSSGITIYLKANTDTIFHRIKNTAKQRPLLLHKTDDELKKWITETIEQREAYYMQAHYIVDEVKMSIPFIISLIHLAK